MDRQERIDAEIKKAIDGRTKEFKEKLAKLAYEKIKAALVAPKEPLKGFPYNEEFTISLDESALVEKLRAGRGTEKIDIDYIGNSGDRSSDERKHKIKIKMTGRQAADVTGQKKDILAFLQGDAYRMDDEDIEEIFPELLEAMINELNARYDLSDMKQSKDPKVKRELAKLMKVQYGSLQYIRQYKEVEAALDKALPAHKRKK